MAVYLGACSSKPQTSSIEDTGTEQIDTLAQKLHQLDSALNCGSLIHLNIYKLGKLKSVEFSVQSVQFGDKELEYINLRKDCGNDYYYMWEDARLLPDECKYLVDAINTIKANLERSTDHEERYAYITKDDIRIIASNSGDGNKWNVALDVDYRKERSEISLSTSDIETFLTYINQGLAKINELN